MEAIQVKQVVIVNQMPVDSHYLKVEGVVAGVKNGFIQIDTSRVMDRWSKLWSNHKCSTASRVEWAEVVK